MTLLEPRPNSEVLPDGTNPAVLAPLHPLESLALSMRLHGNARGRFAAGQFIALLWNARYQDEAVCRVYSLRDDSHEEEHAGFMEVLEVTAPDFEGILVGAERLESLGLFAGRELVRQLIVEEHGRVVCYAAMPSASLTAEV